MSIIICTQCGKHWEESRSRDGVVCSECKSKKKCNHKWVDMEDGTLDKFCVRCSQKAKQAVMPIEINIPIGDLKALWVNPTEKSLKEFLQQPVVPPPVKYF